MTIDKEKLKALAEIMVRDIQGCLSDDEAMDFHKHRLDYEIATQPIGILALLAEIERLEAQVRLAGVAGEMAVHDAIGRATNDYLLAVAERDQLKAERELIQRAGESLKDEVKLLKAENEALRRDAKRYRFLRNQHWPVAELAVVCNPKVSVKLGHDCPSGDRLDQQVDGAMIRGASHD